MCFRSRSVDDINMGKFVSLSKLSETVVVGPISTYVSFTTVVFKYF